MFTSYMLNILMSVYVYMLNVEYFNVGLCLHVKCRIFFSVAKNPEVAFLKNYCKKKDYSLFFADNPFQTQQKLHF